MSHNVLHSCVILHSLILDSISCEFCAAGLYFVMQALRIFNGEKAAR